MTSLIIPAYYADHSLLVMTKRCIDSVGDGVDEVIVVNDGSPMIADFDTINYSKNGGYSHAVNKGLKQAKGDILIVGNNDLVFPEGWLDALTIVLENYDIATCWTSDQEVNKLMNIEQNAKFGSIFAMRRKVYETLGGFDEQFRGYFTDLDYRQRALQHGFSIGKNLDFVIEHDGKATYKQTDPDDEEYQRAMRLFEAKHGFVI